MQTVFKEYPAPFPECLKHMGFVDVSWKNDASGRAVRDLPDSRCLVVWCAEVDPLEREFSKEKRFRFYTCLGRVEGEIFDSPDDEVSNFTDAETEEELEQEITALLAERGLGPLSKRDACPQCGNRVSMGGDYEGLDGVCLNPTPGEPGVPLDAKETATCLRCDPPHTYELPWELPGESAPTEQRCDPRCFPAWAAGMGVVPPVRTISHHRECLRFPFGEPDKMTCELCGGDASVPGSTRHDTESLAGTIHACPECAERERGACHVCESPDGFHTNTCSEIG